MNPLDLLAHFAPNRIAEREINLLLSQQSAARDRLVKFAGKSAKFALGPFVFAFKVRVNGEVEALDSFAQPNLTIQPDVSITGSMEAVGAFLRGGKDGAQAAMAHLNIQGNVGFAQELAFLAENIRYEPEERIAQGLRRIFPMMPTNALDAAAVQGVSIGKGLFSWATDAGSRLAKASADYLVHENPMLVLREDLTQFTSDVEALGHRIERTVKRIERIERNERNR